MIKASQFRITDRPFAVDLSSYVAGPGSGEVRAVWFRRRVGRLAACAGWLRDYQSTCQETAEGFLAAYVNGQYGGDCKARWDGTNLWCLDDEPGRAVYQGILMPMLANYPAVPPGYDGWWVFPR